MEKGTRQIRLRSSAQPNGKTPLGHHPPARHTLRSIQRGPTQSGSKNKILNVLPRVPPADHKLILPVRSQLPLPVPPTCPPQPWRRRKLSSDVGLAPVNPFRILIHSPRRSLRLKEFVLIRAIRAKKRFWVPTYSTLFGGHPQPERPAKHKNYQTNPFWIFRFACKQRRLFTKCLKPRPKTNPFFAQKTHSQTNNMKLETLFIP